MYKPKTPNYPQLIINQPLMLTPNKQEFLQRLVWLNEGMLKNHLNSMMDYTIDQQEMKDYQTYKSV